MILRPQDLVVVLHYALARGTPMTMAGVGSSLGLSASEVHTAIQRSAVANLMFAGERKAHQPSLLLVVREAVVEFVTHGLRYVYLVERGPLTRGFPTAHGVAPLNRIIRSSEPPPVWPDPHGVVRGESFAPLYKNAPLAANANPSMYEALALIDAIRGGKARERQAAAEMFKALLKSKP